MFVPKQILLTKEQDLIKFKKYTKKFLGINLPDEYIKQSDVYVYIDENNNFLAGYLINSNEPFRLLTQIPESDFNKINFLSHFKKHDIFEINALWISPRLKKGYKNLYVWYKMSKNSLKLKKKALLISANTKNTTISKYHKLLKPNTIYEGNPHVGNNNDSSYLNVRYSYVKPNNIKSAWIKSGRHIIKRLKA